MPYVAVGEENSGSIDLYYEDHGSGPPGRADSWLPAQRPGVGQAGPALVEADRRVITYDRRGFG
jgi:pimeloyl-ACP methyl ester carboxylesterase